MSKEGEVQALLWKFILGCVVVKLRIPDIVHGNGKLITVPELASKLALPHIDYNYLHCIIRFLVRMEIFSEEISSSQVQYRLEPATGLLLLRDSDKSMVPIILGMNSRDFMLPWHYIKDWLGEEAGTTVFEKAMGMAIWEYLDVDHEKS